MPIRNVHPGDEPALRAVFYSSVHDLARHHFTAEQLDVWAPRQYDAAQWGERVRGNRPFIAEGTAASQALQTCKTLATWTISLLPGTLLGVAWAVCLSMSV